MGGPFAAPSLLFGILLFLVSMFLMKPARQKRARMLLAAVFGLSLTAGMLAEQQPYVNSWAVNNVFAANLSTTMRTLYSESFRQKIQMDEPSAGKYHSVPAPVPADGRNVIVVLLESWSSWHSMLFGGFEDWTPRLDEAAGRGRRFSNFHAIGFSTDKGLMGIIAGEPLWAPFIHWSEATPFHSMWGVDRSLPAAFSPHGYLTAFLTTGPLELYRKGKWLKHLGFSHVEGRENEFYQGWPQFSFGSAPDRALYLRAEQWRHAAEQPFLLVLETVTTHQPFRDPDSGQKSLEFAMKYADREFGAYLDSLDQSGFFEHGLLVVVSDHRSMTPISAREFSLFGDDAYSRVPMFVIGKEFGHNEMDRSVYSQSDIVPTFEWWLGDKSMLEDNDRIMFSTADHRMDFPPTDNSTCAFHARGNQRGLVDVICTDGRGLVRLDGDHSRFIESHGLARARQEIILTQIARTRLQARYRHQLQTESKLNDIAD